MLVGAELQTTPHASASVCRAAWHTSSLFKMTSNSLGFGCFWAALVLCMSIALAPVCVQAQGVPLCCQVANATLVSCSSCTEEHSLTIACTECTAFSPTAFAGLDSLRELFIQGNPQLESFPADLLCGLDKLKELYIQENPQLESVPAGLLSGRDNMQKLYIQDNARLAGLPASLLSGLVDLETLHIQGNPQIESLPSDLLGSTQRLQDVVLKNNSALASIPEAFLNEQTELRTLVISLNPSLLSVPGGLLRDTAALTSFELRGNTALSSLPFDFFGTLGLLEEVEIGYQPNLNPYPVQNLTGLPSLAQLRLDQEISVGNDEWPRISSLRKLTLGSDSARSQFSPPFFSNLYDLEALTIAQHSGLTYYADHMFSELENLETLRLLDNTNVFRVEPNAFYSLPRVRHVFITWHERLTRLPTGIFDDLGRLSVIVLRSIPLIRELPMFFSKANPKLQVLSLSRNELLGYLPAGCLEGLADLHSVYATDSPLGTSCRAAPTERLSCYMQSTGVANGTTHVCMCEPCPLPHVPTIPNLTCESIGGCSNLSGNSTIILRADGFILCSAADSCVDSTFYCESGPAEAACRIHCDGPGSCQDLYLYGSWLCSSGSCPDSQIVPCFGWSPGSSPSPSSFPSHTPTGTPSASASVPAPSTAPPSPTVSPAATPNMKPSSPHRNTSSGGGQVSRQSDSDALPAPVLITLLVALPVVLMVVAVSLGWCCGCYQPRWFSCCRGDTRRGKQPTAPQAGSEEGVQMNPMRSLAVSSGIADGLMSLATLAECLAPDEYDAVEAWAAEAGVSWEGSRLEWSNATAQASDYAVVRGVASMAMAGQVAVRAAAARAAGATAKALQGARMQGHLKEAAAAGVGSQARLLHVGGVAVPPKLAALLIRHARRASAGIQERQAPHLPTHLMSAASPLAAVARMKGAKATYGGQQRKRAFSRVASSSRRTRGK